MFGICASGIYPGWIEMESRQAGYFCGGSGTITVVIFGSVCGLQNFSKIHQWAEAILPEKMDRMTIALDGKVICSARYMERYESPFHIVSAQVFELGITFAQKSVDGKSNERGCEM